MLVSTGLFPEGDGQYPQNHFSITTSDVTNFTNWVREIYVGGTGDLVVLDGFGVAATYKAVPVGTVLRGMFKRVNATGTTATLLIGRY